MKDFRVDTGSNDCSLAVVRLYDRKGNVAVLNKVADFIPTKTARKARQWRRPLTISALTWVLSFLVAPAQAVSDAENLARFNGQALSMYRSASLSHKELDRIEREIDDFAQGRSSGSDSASKIERAFVEAQLQIDNFSRVLELQYPLPEFTDPSYAALAVEIKDSIQGVDELLGRQSGIGRDLLEAATSGDVAAYAGASVRSLKLSTDFVAAESSMLRAALKLTPADDPGHGLMSAAVDLNDAAITMWSMFAAVHGTTEPSEDAAETLVRNPLDLMADALDRAEDALEGGRSALDNPLGPLGNKTWESRNDEASQEFWTESTASFNRSMEIESDLLTNYRRMRQLILDKSLEPDKVDEKTLAQSFLGIVKANEILVERRLDEIAKRQVLMESYQPPG